MGKYNCAMCPERGKLMIFYEHHTNVKQPSLIPGFSCFQPLTCYACFYLAFHSPTKDLISNDN